MISIMENVFNLEQVAAVLYMSVDKLEELLVEMNLIKSVDSLTVCDMNGYLMESFVRFSSHTEVNLYVTVAGFKALIEEVHNV